MTVDELIARAGSVEQLADALSVARTTVVGWKETGQIPAVRAFQASAAFDIPLSEFVPIVAVPAKRAPRKRETP